MSNGTILGNFKGGYQDLWKAIIRPPRDLYQPKELGIILFLNLHLFYSHIIYCSPST